ncbi:SWIM zinc finger family protein [Phototrophicus methaneseepsis]|uniref:SWIM zinc finger family protein n=1 Tax=Phototrophicus methaneseepsis TaxID=2710758 RepID=A0A7S8EDI0_9CHLR|nr:SWIM zinc finger family protein [Phototrophicus methaneseepsis]QPC84743.1 SWIM zinc finger family protein [Phototrophicus methaneseepsis]
MARPINHNTLVVESVTNPLANHVVTVQFDDDHHVHARCTCPWAVHNGVACTHVIAALQYLAQIKGRRLSFWLTEEEAERQKHRRFYLSGQAEHDGVWITSRPG